MNTPGQPRAFACRSARAERRIRLRHVMRVRSGGNTRTCSAESRLTVGLLDGRYRIQMRESLFTQTGSALLQRRRQQMGCGCHSTGADCSHFLVQHRICCEKGANGAQISQDFLRRPAQSKAGTPVDEAQGGRRHLRRNCTLPRGNRTLPSHSLLYLTAGQVGREELAT